MENFPPLNSIDSVEISKTFFSKKAIIYGICIIVFFLALFYFLFLSSPSNFPIGTIINIEEGENLRGISLDLKNKNIIRSRLAFEAFTIIYGGDRHVISSYYFFVSLDKEFKWNLI